MKTCKSCNQEKDGSDFYKGHAKCKTCYILKVKLHREKNHDYYLEYDRKRANLPHRVKSRELYSKTAAYNESHTKSNIRWLENNSVKRAASTAIGNAIRDGKLIKPCSCSECNVTNVRIHGHHDDYAYPLSVRWLCSKCHRLWHKENGSAINSQIIPTTETRESGFFIAS